MSEFEGGEGIAYIVFIFVGCFKVKSLISCFSRIRCLYDWFFSQAFVPSILIFKTYMHEQSVGFLKYDFHKCG